MNHGASFSNHFVASPTSQLILQPFRRFTFVTAQSTTPPLLHLRHRHFTYVTCRAAHALNVFLSSPLTVLYVTMLPGFRVSYTKCTKPLIPKETLFAIGTSLTAVSFIVTRPPSFQVFYVSELHHFNSEFLYVLGRPDYNGSTLMQMI